MNSPRWISAQTILIPLLLLVAMTCYGEAGAAQLRLTWTDNSNDEDGFKIERKLGQAGTFSQVATVGPNIISYTDTGLTGETTYCFRVRAFNAAGDSAYSNENCATTPVNQPPVVGPISSDATDVDPATSGLQVWTGTIVTYSGSATDVDGDPLNWEWRYTENGGIGVLVSSGTNPPTPVPDVTLTYISGGSSPATYVWILRASDGQDTAEATLTVQVLPLPGNNSPPPVASTPSAPDPNPYGGCVAQPVPSGATGFFHVEKVGARWMFVTPEGDAFWLRAVNGVDITFQDQTYAEAVKAKYNSPTEIPWWTFTSQAARRLKSWGFNALGENHSLYALPVGTEGRTQANEEKLPFIRMIRLSATGVTEGRFSNIITGTHPSAYTGWRGGTFADVFAPAFKTLAQELASDIRGEFTSPLLDESPWLIGTSVDDANDTYGFGHRPEASSTDFDPHLGWIAAVTAPTQDGATVYTKLAFRDFLREKYQSLSALNAAWLSTYTSWDSDGGWPNGTGVLDESGQHAWIGQDFNRLSDAGPQVKVDLDEFLEKLAEQYFSVVAEAVRAYVPGRLVFSPAGIGAGARPQILRAAARHLDVLQVVVPPDRLELLEEAYQVANKPIFVQSTFQSQADSPWKGREGWGPAYDYSTQEDRGEAYASYVQQLLALQAPDGSYPVVGVDWWAWKDSTESEDDSDQDRCNCGLVTILDNAYDGLEAVVADGTDPWGYSTGGEQESYGDFLSDVIIAHDQVCSHLISSGTGTSSSTVNTLASAGSATSASGGAAFDPVTATLALGLGALALFRRSPRRRRRKTRP